MPLKNADLQLLVEFLDVVGALYSFVLPGGQIGVEDAGADDGAAVTRLASGQVHPRRAPNLRDKSRYVSTPPDRMSNITLENRERPDIVVQHKCRFSPVYKRNKKTDPGADTLLTIAILSKPPHRG